MNTIYRCRRRRRGCGSPARNPYYTGPCADVNGCYTNGEADRCDRCDRSDRCGWQDRCGRCGRCGCRGQDDMCSGMFLAYLPMAVSANGIIPLRVNNPCRNSDFDVNSGLITLKSQGTYLATYSVRMPEGAQMNTTVTLNVDDASQSSAITQINATGDGTSGYTAQAIFEADEGATVSLRTSDAIGVTESSSQPLFSLSLVQLTE